MKTIENKDSFSIGTAGNGGSVKVYLEDIHSEEAIAKIDRAIMLWRNAKVITGSSGSGRKKIKFPERNIE